MYFPQSLARELGAVARCAQPSHQRQSAVAGHWNGRGIVVSRMYDAGVRLWVRLVSESNQGSTALSSQCKGDSPGSFDCTDYLIS